MTLTRVCYLIRRLVQRGAVTASLSERYPSEGLRRFCLTFTPTWIEYHRRWDVLELIWYHFYRDPGDRRMEKIAPWLVMPIDPALANEIIQASWDLIPGDYEIRRRLLEAAGVPESEHYHRSAF